MNKDLLIVFVKAPTKGKVKTRLAATIGDSKAVEVYRKLLAHTFSLVTNDKYDTYIYFGDEISNDIVFPNYPKFSQRGDDLGARMKNAFEDSFAAGYKRIVLIGSDCLEIDQSTIQNAIAELKDVDLCLGPADDGGYYLIGMSKLSAALFDDKPWSQPNLMAETKRTIKELNLTSYFLQQLSDIDNAEDLAKHKDYERFLS